MTDKPWLGAKTAGEALGAWLDTIGTTRGWKDGASQAVIEWHEAQREKVGESWELWCVGSYVDTFDTREQIRTERCGAECKAVHVTRYRRKR